MKIRHRIPIVPLLVSLLLSLVLVEVVLRGIGFRSEELRAAYFFKDEVHLTEAGNQRIAESLVQCFLDNRLLGLEAEVQRAIR